MEYTGDSLLPRAAMVFDQTITIDAPPSNIFPWIEQLGKGRGGWYLPASWERFLPKTWAAAHSINPAHKLEKGDRVPDYGTKDDYFDVVEIDRPRSLVYESRRFGTDFTWAILLHELSEGKTQVHLRFRGDISATGVKRRMILFWGGLLDYVTTAPMLRGLRERAERGPPGVLPDLDSAEPHALARRRTAGAGPTQPDAAKKGN